MSVEQAIVAEMMYNVANKHPKTEYLDAERNMSRVNKDFNYGPLDKPYGLKDNNRFSDVFEKAKIGYDMPPNEMYKPMRTGKSVLDSFVYSMN